MYILSVLFLYFILFYRKPHLTPKFSIHGECLFLMMEHLQAKMQQISLQEEHERSTSAHTLHILLTS